MSKRNTIIAILVAAGILIIGAGAFFVIRGHDKQSPTEAAQTVGDHTVTLGQDSNSGGLTVNGQAGSLGQLNGDSNGQSQGAAGSSSGSSSSSGDVNPASFAQYDKYKSSQNALFGEIQPGNGAALAVGQKANIYYKVWLTNGALVDQSPVSAAGQPQPFTFTLGEHKVIAGLEQGIAGMKVGGKRLIIVPPVVGYGSQGQGSVPANAVLVFEVQLLSAQ